MLKNKRQELLRTLKYMMYRSKKKGLLLIRQSTCNYFHSRSPSFMKKLDR